MSTYTYRKRDIILSKSLLPVTSTSTVFISFASRTLHKCFYVEKHVCMCVVSRYDDEQLAVITKNKNTLCGHLQHYASNKHQTRMLYAGSWDNMNTVAHTTLVLDDHKHCIQHSACHCNI